MKNLVAWCSAMRDLAVAQGRLLRNCQATLAWQYQDIRHLSEEEQEASIINFIENIEFY